MPPPSSTGDRPLDGVVVVDLAGPPGVFATRVLADLGARVLRVEPPGGDEVRRRAPFLEGDGPLVERSLYHRYHNANKESVVVDGGTEDGRRALVELLGVADVVVETAGPGELEALGCGYDDVRAGNPGVVWASVTPFGRTGPWAGRTGGDLVAAASGGLLWVSGSPKDPPVLAGADQSYKMASLAAATGVVIALHGAVGARVEISVQEAVAMAVVQTANPAIYRWQGRIPGRPGLTMVHRCADERWVTLNVAENRRRAFLDWLADAGVETDATVEDLVNATGSPLAARLARQLAPLMPRDEFLAAAWKRDLMALPCNSLPELAECEHLRAIDEFVEVDDEVVGRALSFPRSPVATAPEGIPVRPAPRLGYHDPIGPGRRAAPAAPDGRLPLAGVRVLDFCWVLAGPLGTRILANFGAEVLRVEAPERPFVDILPPGESDAGLGSFHNLVDTGKRSITVDPRTDRGRELLLELASTCDAVTNNYRPGALENLGLGYEQLRAVNPAIVLLHMPGCGRRGPWAGRGTLGNMVVAASGLSFLTGFGGRSPRGVGVAYPDFTSPYLAATALVAWLRQAGETGCGAELELNQLSATISLIGVEWMHYRATGEAPPPRANRDPNCAPHGVYPSSGEDEWIAIAVDDEPSWRALCGVMGRPDLARDPRFADLAARKGHEDELDGIIAAWTAAHDRWVLADRLQDAGVAAAAVENVADALERDPQLARHYRDVRQPWAPDVSIIVQDEIIRLAGREVPLRPAPRMGEDNRYVCCELLGMSDDEYAQLLADGVIR